ncbi:Octaprenyl-diphosphate synthase [Rhodobacteraceae bacterium THAF1]|nr:Octaprenyl-diphosphate synthase [Palleronia sp. THAF1]VDC17301.1 Octaprenyl-diphosphate synthase [Rhodobacteraceae bacterium THAF1]
MARTLGVAGDGGKGARMDKQIKPHERLAQALAEPLAEVDALIRARMASENAPRIPEVTQHLVGGGGKRIRPMLTLASARLMGYPGPFDVHLAATVEFIHTATLLHDDVVDESNERRGRPTANLLWDNKSSVLVGDYLFARSFQLMVETGSIRVLDILANAAATIAEGEVLQLTAMANLATTEDTYLRIVRGKTAALFSAATEVGGVIAGAPEDNVQALHTYGDALGIAFQMADDVIDWMDGTGKGVGDDFRERKMTLPIIRAVAASDRDFWTRTIGKGVQKDADLERAAVLLAETGALDSTRATAVDWAETAKAALADLPDAPLRDMLRDLADYVVARLR